MNTFSSKAHKARNVYLHPFRPHYEKSVAVAWLAVSALLLLEMIPASMPRTLLLVLAVACACVAFPWLTAWRKLARMALRMAHAEVSVLPMQKTLAVYGGKSSRAFLGWGFDWTNEEAQVAREVAIADPSKIVQARESDAAGQAWIHGIGREEVPIYLPVADEHTLIVAMTRSGKTVLYRELIAQAIERGEAVFVIDPKGDEGMRKACEQACAAMKKPLLVFHPGFPATSVRMDPLKNYNDPSELASRISALLGRSAKDKAFTDFAFMQLVNVVNGMLLAGRRPTLVAIKRYLDGGLETLLAQAIRAYCNRELTPGWEASLQPYKRAVAARRKRRPEEERGETLDLTPVEEAQALTAYYRDNVREARGSPEIEGLMATVEHPAEHRSKMLTSLMPILTKLTSGPLARLLSTDETDSDDTRLITDSARIIEQQQVVYIGLNSLGNEDVANAIGEILLADLAAVCGDRYNYAESKRVVSIFVDEAVEILNAELIKLLNKGGGAGFRLTLATQTVSDIEARLGNAAMAEKILGNVNNFLFGRVTAPQSQEYFTARLPVVPITTMSFSRSVSSPTEDPLQFNSSQGESLQVRMEPPIAPTLLGCLPKLHFFALIGSRFVKLRIPVLVPD